MSDDCRFKPLKNQLENDHLLVRGSYPKTVVEAKRMMMESIAPGGKSNGNEKQQQLQSDGEHGLSFFQENTDWQKNVQCHGCGAKGHLLKACRKTSVEDKENIYATKRDEFKAAQTSTQSTLAIASMGAINVIVEEDGAEKSAEPMHVKLREMCGFTSVNVASPPDEEEFGSIDRVEKWVFLFAEATESGGWKVHSKKSGG